MSRARRVRAVPKNKHGRGRGRQPQRRHLRPVPVRTGQGVEQQELFQSLRRTLRSEEPLELLAVVSGLLEVTDPRSRDPFTSEQRPGIETLVESLVGTPYAETTAALTAMGQRPDRVVLVDAENRVLPPAHLRHESRCQERCRRLDRRDPQPEQTTLLIGHAHPSSLREAAHNPRGTSRITRRPPDGSTSACGSPRWCRG